MKEVFEIINNCNCINNIPIDDLNKLFIENCTEVYDISMIGKGKIVLKNKQDNKFVKLDCICNCFDVGNNTDCVDIRRCIGCSDNANCKECYKEALIKLDIGEMSLK